MINTCKIITLYAALALASIIAGASASGQVESDAARAGQAWRVRTTHRLQRALEVKGGLDPEGVRKLFESLSLHEQARTLLEHTDLPMNIMRKVSQGLDQHAKMVDKAVENLAGAGPARRLSDFADFHQMKKLEASVLRHYNDAVRNGAVPPPPPKVEEFRAALLEATGIDATQDGDGKLFDIMLEHYAGTPPAAALGVSAKFWSDGRKQTARYHIGLRLPCATVASDDSARLAASSHAAASALSAPKIVHAWIDAVGDAPVGMGFGFARIDDKGNKAGKIYVMNLAGKTMPPLPLSLGVERAFSKSIYDSIPLLQPKGNGDAQMVSLEWRIGSDSVILRHYAAERGATHDQRIQSSGTNAEALSSLVSSAGAKTEVCMCCNIVLRTHTTHHTHTHTHTISHPTYLRQSPTPHRSA
jgi:hypothetical protein